MSLKNLIAVGILFCSFLFNLTGVCVSGQIIDLETGGYLSEEYIEKLLKTKSPRASENIKGIFARVEKGKKAEDKYIISAGSFSDSYGAIHITPEGKLNKNTSVNLSFPDNPIQIVSKNKFIINTAASSKISYIFVGDPTSWVSSQLMAGEYVDEKDMIYEFKNDGTVYFSKTMYKYRISLDFSEPPFVDCLYIGDQTYKYKIKGNKLILYKISGKEYETISRTPSIVLIKQKAP